MKVTVRIICGKEERTIDIACGDGQKTFKWLGMVASQRFAGDAPHGALRRYDELRGINDRAQQHAFDILLPSGDKAHPSELIIDLLNHEDEVIIDLLSNLNVDNCGLPQPSKWSEIAFTSRDSMNVTDEFASESKLANDKTFTLSDEDVKSKIDFMRLVLGTQIIDYRKISLLFEVHWPHVKLNLRRLNEDQSNKLKDILQKHYGILMEIFERFSMNGKMGLPNFQAFMKEAQVHPIAREFESLTKQDFLRAAASVDGSSLHFGAFLHSLMLTSQGRLVDTLDSSAQVRSPTDAIVILLNRHILPLADQHRLPYLTKEAFCSESFLLQVRLLHDKLFEVFEKYAFKSNKDNPTSISAEVMGELLYECQLSDLKPEDSVRENMNSKATKEARALLLEVKKGIIVGRPKFDVAELEQETSKHVVLPPETEYTFPEFVDAISRMGQIKHSDKRLTESMLRGLHDVITPRDKAPPSKQSNARR